MEFRTRLHSDSRGEVLAICDASIVGMTFRGDGLRITVDESFYGGDTVSEKEALESMRRSHVVNMVGNDIVGLAISNGIVSEANVVVIGEVKHAQAVRM